MRAHAFSLRCPPQLKLTLTPKFLAKPLDAALITPFLGAYNKKMKDATPLTAADLARVEVDGKVVASITDIAADDIKRLAEEIGEADGCVIFCSRGINQWAIRECHERRAATHDGARAMPPQGAPAAKGFLYGSLPRQEILRHARRFTAVAFGRVKASVAAPLQQGDVREVELMEEE